MFANTLEPWELRVDLRAMEHFDLLLIDGQLLSELRMDLAVVIAGDDDLVESQRTQLLRRVDQFAEQALALLLLVVIDEADHPVAAAVVLVEVDPAGAGTEYQHPRFLSKPCRHIDLVLLVLPVVDRHPSGSPAR